MIHKVVFVRHGQSLWNLNNRFTGWVDVDLSERGIREARQAGRALREAGFQFDITYTSFLKRSVRTLWLILEELDQMWLPIHTDWRLNERHYGALQGLDKRETTERHGAEQVQRWRRGYAVRPPALSRDDPSHPAHDPRYEHVPNVPSTESLADTLARVLPYWNDVVATAIANGKRPLVVAHGNSLRALIKHLDDISEDEIVELNIPTGIPLVYELDDALRAVHREYLGDEEVVAAAMQEVRQQTSAKR